MRFDEERIDVERENRHDRVANMLVRIMRGGKDRIERIHRILKQLRGQLRQRSGESSSISE